MIQIIATIEETNRYEFKEMLKLIENSNTLKYEIKSSRYTSTLTIKKK